MQITETSPFALEPGEQLLWSGAPLALRIFRARGLIAVGIGAGLLTKVTGVLGVGGPAGGGGGVGQALRAGGGGR